MKHDTNVLCSISYNVEVLFCLAPFMKHLLEIVLQGMTADHIYPLVDVRKATALLLLKQFGIDGKLL